MKSWFRGPPYNGGGHLGGSVWVRTFFVMYMIYYSYYELFSRGRQVLQEPGASRTTRNVVLREEDSGAAMYTVTQMVAAAHDWEDGKEDTSVYSMGLMSARPLREQGAFAGRQPRHVH